MLDITLPLAPCPPPTLVASGDGHAAVKDVQAAVPVLVAVLPDVVLDASLQSVQVLVALGLEEGGVDVAADTTSAVHLRAFHNNTWDMSPSWQPRMLVHYGSISGEYFPATLNCVFTALPQDEHRVKHFQSNLKKLPSQHLQPSPMPRRPFQPQSALLYICKYVDMPSIQPGQKP